MTIKIRGLKEIEDLLGQLPDRVSQRVLAAALRKGAAIIAKSAREKARNNPSVDSGLLAESITSRSRRKSKKGRYYGSTTVSVGALRVAKLVKRKGHDKPVKAVPSRYAHLVEFGTKSMPAEPFLRPALDEQGDLAIRVITEAMATRIDAEAAKMAAGKISFATGKKL